MSCANWPASPCWRNCMRTSRRACGGWKNERHETGPKIGRVKDMSESTVNAKRVLSVGQCFADHSSISRVLRHSFTAEVVGTDTSRQALEQLRQEAFALV